MVDDFEVKSKVFTDFALYHICLPESYVNNKMNLSGDHVLYLF